MTNAFQSQSLNDWLFYLEQQHPSEIELGLGRVQQVADKAQLKDFKSSKVILVAGTNGKGTTIRFLESYLLAEGHSVGVYSSPHLFKYNERVRLNGLDATDQQHIDAFDYIEQTRGDVPLTYFEFGTLAGLCLLQKQALDFVLIEVGLGGRLDATNILEHDISVITSIGLDHIDWLGDDLETIAFEKAGIMRPNKPAVIGEPVQYENFVKQAKTHLVSAVHQVNQAYSYEHNGNSWQVQIDGTTYSDLTLPLIPIQNVATALMVLRLLHITLTKNKINDVLQTVSLPGRMQLISQDPVKVVDVAHNSHAIKYLLDTISVHPRFSQHTKLDIVIAMMKDKDISDSLHLFEGKVNNWYVAELPNNSRAAKADDLAKVLRQQGEKNVHVLPSVVSAWQQAERNQSTETLLLGLGSFYTVAEILAQKEV